MHMTMQEYGTTSSGQGVATAAETPLYTALLSRENSCSTASSELPCRSSCCSEGGSQDMARTLLCMRTDASGADAVSATWQHHSRTQSSTIYCAALQRASKMTASDPTASVQDM
jgi:hypothetical protein